MGKEVTSIYPHFKDFNLKVVKNYTTITFNNKEIKVAQYLSIDEKIALIDIALQKSMINGMIHPGALLKYYTLGLVYMYSDIVFTDEDRADEANLYDTLVTTGLLNKILAEIPIKEKDECDKLLNDTKIAIEKHKVSAVGIIETLIQVLSNEVPNIMEQLAQLTPEQAKATLEAIMKAK